MVFSDIWNISFHKPDGVTNTLESYRDNRYIIIVNTATLCGLAGQMSDLNALFEAYREQGVVVLGFPCAQFASQEKTNDADMQQVCLRNFGATFPIFARIDVNGENTHPLFLTLKDLAPGLLGSQIKWNFTKFLIDIKRESVTRFAPITPVSRIEKYIKKGLTE